MSRISGAPDLPGAVGARRARRKLKITGLAHFCQRRLVVWKQVPHPRYGDRVAYFVRSEVEQECACRESARFGMSRSAYERLMGKAS